MNDKSEAPVGGSGGGHDGIEAMIVDRGDRLLLVGLDRDRVRGPALAVQDLVQNAARVVR